MKRTDLVRILEKDGWYLKRNGGEHDIFAKGTARVVIPRHTEIKEGLAKKILKDAGLK